MIEGVKPTIRGSSGVESSSGTQLRQVCAEFESLLIHYILKAGRQTLPGNGLFDNSHESKVYHSMMDEKVAISVAKSRGMGIGELMYRQLEKNHEPSKKMAKIA